MQATRRCAEETRGAALEPMLIYCSMHTGRVAICAAQIRRIRYGIMTEERVIREIDEAAGRGDSDSRMTRFDVIMPL